MALLTVLASSVAYNNGMGRKPPMGWQTWCSVGPCGEDHCFDGQIREMADTLVTSGMKDLGYNWVILDDCWHPSRNDNGTLVPYPRFFPDGMKPVIDYVHAKGLQFGLYTSVGDKTCHGGWSPGSYGHYEHDANTFASWGVDYVKIDYCGDHDSVEGHRNMSHYLNATGRHISYMLCRGPYQHEDHWGYAPSIAQGWRATGDHHDTFSSTKQQVDAVRHKGSWSGPYGWHYLDMMMIGGEGCKSQCVGPASDKGHCNWTIPEHCPGQSDTEYRTEASMYVVVSSPMMVGTDIRQMTPIMRELLLNKEAIAINQDYEATPGDVEVACADPDAPPVCSVALERQMSKAHGCVAGRSFGCTNGTNQMWVTDGCRGDFQCNGNSGVRCGEDGQPHSVCACAGEATTTQEVWVRRLTGGDFAVAMPNWGDGPEKITLCLDQLKWPHGETARARDVWATKDLGTISKTFSATVAPHDTLLLRLSPGA